MRPIVAAWVRRMLRRQEPFRAIADAAPVMLRLAAIDGLCTYLNRGWLDFTGSRSHEQLGSGWNDAVHPDDRSRVREIGLRAAGGGSSFRVEYRLRHRDGDYRRVVDTGAPWHDARGRVAGYVDSVVDVSGRRRAEETLRDLGGRLIAAQEEERRRIARELHDDLSQRLALLSMEIEHLERECGLAPDNGARWKALSQAAADIASDLHRISHRLHPSRLEALGLVAAISGLCQEMWTQQSLRVRFTHLAVPPAIPSDVALCLYRIVQEALQNVIKHSGRLEAEVHLEGLPVGLQLRIADPGGGFSPDRRDGVGLGLFSMRERVHSLGGDIVVQAAPGRGTRIGVRIPLQPAIAIEQVGLDLAPCQSTEL
jgi:PAS domain S-box-containing protein